MRSFAAGEIDVLVSTTVIEVGVDVANATTMVLLDADRFGISQLHQMRGRVGRGGLPGLCLLVSYAEARLAGARAARRGGRHHRRLRAEPGRPRPAPRGRRARRLAVRLPVQPDDAPGAPRRGHDRGRARGGHPPARAGSGARPCAESPTLWRSWSNHGSLTSWRRPQLAPMTRIIGGSAGGRRLATPARDQHAAQQRPRARGAVLGHRVLVRLAPGAALPRPVRRVGCGRAGGMVARRRCGHAGRAGPPHRRPDPSNAKTLGFAGSTSSSAR